VLGPETPLVAIDGGLAAPTSGDPVCPIRLTSGARKRLHLPGPRLAGRTKRITALTSRNQGGIGAGTTGASRAASSRVSATR
jgi:hypothetical protein